MELTSLPSVLVLCCDCIVAVKKEVRTSCCDQEHDHDYNINNVGCDRKS
jgi:hypothetical protein